MRARSRAKLPEADRAERALLFGGPARCAVCGGSLSIKRNGNVKHNPWMYICSHLDTPYHRRPLVSMMAHKLDGAVWTMAVAAMRDPAFLDGLIAQTDAAIGPAIRVESLRQQLAEAQSAHMKLLGQLERLDADDELVADYQDKLRQNKALQASLTEALAAQQAVEAEAARRATLVTFRDYAAQEAATLDEKTPLERWHILLALRTRVRLHSAERADRLRIIFDIRGLPGAATALLPVATEQPAHWADFTNMALPTVEWLQTPDAVGFQPDGTPEPEEGPCPESTILYTWRL